MAIWLHVVLFGPLLINHADPRIASKYTYYFRPNWTLLDSKCNSICRPKAHFTLWVLLVYTTHENLSDGFGSIFAMSIDVQALRLTTSAQYVTQFWSPQRLKSTVCFQVVFLSVQSSKDVQKIMHYKLVNMFSLNAFFS